MVKRNKYIEECEEYEEYRECEEYVYVDTVPYKSKVWIAKGREILDKSKWELWERIVPIRLYGIYQGIELRYCLDIIQILKNGTFEEAKKEVERQNHSAESFKLICSMIRDFSSEGDKFINYIKIDF